MNNYLKNWLAALDRLIGDTEIEIKKRREANINAVYMRNDLNDLIVYMKNNDLPPSVLRALNYCLSWNPHTREVKELIQTRYEH